VFLGARKSGIDVNFQMLMAWVQGKRLHERTARLKAGLKSHLSEQQSFHSNPWVLNISIAP